MVRLVLFLLGVAAVAAGFHWLANEPGQMLVNWRGYEVETSVFQAIVILAVAMALGTFVWNLLRQLWKRWSKRRSDPLAS